MDAPPALTSSMNVSPFSLMAWTRALPAMTYAHSPEVCQCISRYAPASNLCSR